MEETREVVAGEWVQRWYMRLLGALALVAAVSGPNTPLWDPAHPDQNVGARPLEDLQHPTPLSAAAGDGSGGGGGSAPFELLVGRATVGKGVGLLLRGRAARGAVLLEGALRASDRLLSFRALSSLNHCWRPNARLLRRAAPARGEAVYDLVAVAEIDGGEGAEQSTEVLIDYSATPGFIELPRSSWRCLDPAPAPGVKGPPQLLSFELDRHYQPWKLHRAEDVALFSRWRTALPAREPLVVGCSSGPEGMMGMPTSGR
eukprot:COSAG04_NODE_718_length_10851_cov_8.135231_11_plen_259_part_00